MCALAGIGFVVSRASRLPLFLDFTPPDHRRVLVSVPTRRSSDLGITVIAGMFTPADAGRVANTLLAVGPGVDTDRKSTRLNSSHVAISYAVFCLKTQILLFCIISLRIMEKPGHLCLFLQASNYSL